MSRYWHTPIRITATKTLAWFKTGAIEFGKPVYTLQDPQKSHKSAPLSFPMKGGSAKGCIQDMSTPPFYRE